MLIVKIHNNGTGTNEKANYDYGVYVNETLIAMGNIYDHNRNNGWVNLLEMLVKEEIGENE